MHQKTGVTGIILAGGKNSRMGTHKALLKIGGRPIIEIVSAILRPITDEIVIVSNNPGFYETYGDRVVGDISAGRGPLGGIHSGLLHSAYEKALVAACDMPFVSTALANLLVENSPGYDVVVPVYRGYPEPLFALYDKRCISAIQDHLVRGQNKITGFYDDVRVRRLEENELRAAEPELDRVFFNVNTPADLEKAQTLT